LKRRVRNRSRPPSPVACHPSRLLEEHQEIKHSAGSRVDPRLRKIERAADVRKDFCHHGARRSSNGQEEISTMTARLVAPRSLHEVARDSDEGEEAVTALLRMIGEDPSRNGLLETPRRVVKALHELTAGYAEDPAEILSKTFEETSDELIVLRNIEFHSLCEHHLLPFYGTASVGYLPGEVVGISKLARLVHCYARRLQIQERLTRQIADAIALHLHARGTGVIVQAHHLCMGCRGVRQASTEMITSAMLGTLREDAVTRGEFLELCAAGNRIRS
jgi:GTP cyclohydrolase I